MAFDLLVTGVSQLGGRFTRLPRALVEAEKRGIHAAGLHVERQVRKRFKGYSPGRRGDSDNQVRSGKLRQSLNTSEPEPIGNAHQVRVGYRKGVVDRYARIQEEGGTVKAHNRLLAIPLPAALTAAGVLRVPTSGGRWLDRFPGGFWFTSKKGNAIFARRAGEGLELLAVGKPSVTIPPHRMLQRSLEESRAKIGELVGFQIRKAAEAFARGN